MLEVSIRLAKPLLLSLEPQRKPSCAPALEPSALLQLTGLPGLGAIWPSSERQLSLLLTPAYGSLSFLSLSKRGQEEPDSMRRSRSCFRWGWGIEGGGWFESTLSDFSSCSALTLTGVTLLWSAECFHTPSIPTSAHTTYSFTVKSRRVLNLLLEPSSTNQGGIARLWRRLRLKILPCRIDTSRVFSAFGNQWC